MWFYKECPVHDTFLCIYRIVRPLSTVGYTSVANAIHSRQWSNYLNS